MIDKIRKRFTDMFHQDPLLLRAPGRVNLIGEHTDYNMGFVLPAAVDKAIYFAIALREDSECRLYSVDMEAEHIFRLDEPLQKSGKGWPDYILGVIDQFQKVGFEVSRGFNLVFGGDIPIGAGMSSSAALECGIAYAMNHFFDFGINKKDLALLAQRAENQFVGVNSGIMDQFASLFGLSGKVIRIDCRSLEYTYFPFEFDDIAIVLADTGVSHSLASSEYNTRRQECEAGLAILQSNFPGIQSLRDVDMHQLEQVKGLLKGNEYERCKYVIAEIERTLKACDRLNENDPDAFGKLMYETHFGLSKEYEVSCEELDILVNLTLDMEYVLGARMMGGGFGGCTINLVKKAHLDKFTSIITAEYKRITGRTARIYINNLTDGVSTV